MSGGALADGLIAGAVGTTALNVVTYLDITLRARPASQTPEESAGRLTDAAHVSLGPPKQAANRRSGIGALMGYGLGVAAAVGFAMLARGRRQPTLRAAALLGGGAMTLSDGSLTLLGVTDPRTWRRADWLADLVPHLAYGLTAAATWNRLRPSTPGGR
ncbi:hypothetical protein [Micromonospora radicis]|uniref:Uncharacterized protein n=1 Tax=Micromonospora radicis TaxID=1894971 RepID=A0A418MT86_9ACTN|nr:hypothetical protein [Micromonospora radicis]RIV37331.1 hypothetical protein D2L64_15715 [Micromonospora radicis]